MTHVIALHRHPVKGFTAEPMTQVALSPGAGLPRDRHFAFISGRKPETPKPGGWVQPRTFLMQAADPQLAAFHAHYDDATGLLKIIAPDSRSAIAMAGKPETFGDVEDLLAAYFEAGPHGDIRLIEQDGVRGNWDFSDTEISIINSATMREIEKACGVPLVWERFRGNIYVDGLAPWEEFSWPGRQVQIGGALVDIMRPIQRCAMTSTTPGTGARDIDLPATMLKAFGHNFCGVYARVAIGGEVALDDDVALMQAAELRFDPHARLPERVAAPSLWPRVIAAKTEENGSARVSSSAAQWPLIDAKAGQTLKVHARHFGDRTRRIKIIASDASGWSIDELIPQGALISGPYGRKNAER